MKQASLIVALCLAVVACSDGGGGGDGGGSGAPSFQLDNPASTLVPTPPSNTQLPAELLPPA